MLTEEPGRDGRTRSGAHGATSARPDDRRAQRVARSIGPVGRRIGGGGPPLRPLRLGGAAQPISGRRRRTKHRTALDPAAPHRHRSPGDGGAMRPRLGIVVGALRAAGCSGGPKCPKPIAYDAATLKKIEKARESLPRDSILQQVLLDYENER